MKTLMTHLYYGEVSQEFSEELALTLVSAGTDLLEIGIPYSDPVCDGEIFQTACRRALKQGIIPDDVFGGIKKIRQKTIIPIYLTSYFAPIFKIGIRNFLSRARESGVNGLIIPDLPLEEQQDFRKYCIKENLSLIQFATVYTSEERLKKIIAASVDFIYVISLPGITGDNNPGQKNLKKLLDMIKNKTAKKIYAGFGIRTPAQAAKIVNLGADGIVIGSRIAEIYNEQHENRDECFEKIRKLVINVKKAINREYNTNERLIYG